MTSLNASHLFEQAERLVATSPPGAPRQVNLRRAISTAYYGLFHLVLGIMADFVVGRSNRNRPLYALAYRSVEHGAVRTVCAEILKPVPSSRYRPYVPASGFEAGLRVFAADFITLQGRRHSADYDPLARFSVADALLLIRVARQASDRFAGVSTAQRKLFLTLLLCPPR